MPRELLSAFLLALALALPSPVLAAREPDRAASVEQAAPDDGELSAFVAAFLRLVGVQHGYMMLMRDENDPAKMEQIKQSALADMKNAVERDGLSISRYNQIALSVRDDPGVRSRVEGLLQQMAADPSGAPSGADEE
ncbi:MAG: DUF4168 domain-containing protein [Bacteroidales bacterium]